MASTTTTIEIVSRIIPIEARTGVRDRIAAATAAGATGPVSDGLLDPPPPLAESQVEDDRETDAQQGR